MLDTRFWDERAGALVDVWNRDWSELEAYRGANANMHGVEAMLATGDPLWRERAVRVTQRLVVENHPRLNEHFDADWRPLPDYNRAEPAHPFRPYGATIGHWFEWARLAYTLDAARFEADARRLFAARVARRLGRLRASSTPSTGTAGRSSPTGCTGCCARRSPPPRCSGEDALQAEWWEVAERDFIDRERRLVAARARPVQPARRAVWDGKPDVYHALQATLIPRFPLRVAGRKPASLGRASAGLRPPGSASSRPSAAASSPPP